MWLKGWGLESRQQNGPWGLWPSPSLNQPHELGTYGRGIIAVIFRPTSLPKCRTLLDHHTNRIAPRKSVDVVVSTDGRGHEPTQVRPHATSSKSASEAGFQG
jgi:hypothetical protein